MDAKGRTALVTGGGRGIGREVALGLARDGADVAISYRKDEESAIATVAEIEALGRRALAIGASVDDVDQARNLARTALDQLGPIDVLVHSAGIASRGQDVAHTDPAEIERLFRTHALGAFVLCQELVPPMRERDRGDVVMISSAATTHLAANSSPYNMAKAALEALAMTLAKEERRNGIHVNVVAPGLVATEMGRRLVKGAMGVEDIGTLDARSPFGHVCTPEEVADVVRFLVGSGGRYVTGVRVAVDGGTF
ncbi:MAG TPA: SDR family oxidoreductase [Acidimicrobiia bacterium]|jgi:NAD(P)-dependent dehydrogenase (short-subunit alcohol dehydrogenase family)